MKRTTMILAAGQGTRMKSQMPKVLHKVMGKTMLDHVIDSALQLQSEKVVVIIGHGADQVRESVKNDHVAFIVQEQQLGTGHAVIISRDHIDPDSQVLVLYGDTPLISTETLESFASYHQEKGNDLTVLSMMADNPFGYGRLTRDSQGNLAGIVEQKDATDEQKLIKEVNTGIYLMDGRHLLDNLGNIKNDNNQKEYYLTDLVKIFKNEGLMIDSFVAPDADEFLGVNDRLGLAEANHILKNRINKFHMINGVTIVDPASTYIEKGVVIGADTVIHPNTHIKGNTVIGLNCSIGPNSNIENTVLGNYVTVLNSTVTDSKVDDKTKIGPYAYLRPGSDIGKNVKIGDFVEVKNSRIDDDSKVSHLTYVGDADVGKNVNLGCGVVFVNYDGVRKFRSTVGDNSFVGCNVNLVSPVNVSQNAYVAAGTTLTQDVPEHALAIGREKQRNIEGWVLRKRG